MSLATTGSHHRLVILYGLGGLSDCGRHAVQAALEQKKAGTKIDSITVLTQHPELLDESNWNCGCPEPHSFTEEEKKQFTLIPVPKWSDTKLESYFEKATAVVSCLGNRQPTFMNVTPESWCSEDGNNMVIRAMNKYNVPRVVALSSMGINEDWPPMEFHWAGKAMSLIFTCFARKAYRDLSNMENAYRSSLSKNSNYLFVRPVGIGEDTVPNNQWYIQKEKYTDVDKMTTNIAKLDVGRYMIQEALTPTRHNDALVICGVEEQETSEKK